MVITNDTLAHTYSKSGTYIVKTKNGRINTTVTSVTLRNVLTKILKLRKFIGDNFLFRQCYEVTSINLDNCELPNGCLFYRTLRSNVTELSMVNTKLPSDTSSWNYMLDGETPSNITVIRGIEDLDVSHVTSFQGLFSGFSGLTSLDLSRWNTSNATSMENMFKNCSSLIEPPIKNIPSSVKNTVNMYVGCTSLTKDVVIPRSVTDCSNMFNGCTSMTHIHSNWNNSYNSELTSTDCYSGCTAITHIDNESVISYEGDNALDYVPFEWGGNGLIDDGTISIIEVTIPSDNYNFGLYHYNYAFSKRYNVDIADSNCINWGDGETYSSTETTHGSAHFPSHTYVKAGVYYMKGSFGTFSVDPANDTEGLYGYKDGSCVTGIIKWATKIYDAQKGEYFTQKSLYDCFKNLTNLKYVRNLQFNNGVEILNSLFNGCTSLTSIDFNGCDTSNVTNMQNMFYGCTSLQSLNLSGWDVSKVTRIKEMFKNCSNLTILNLNGLNFSSLANYSDASYELFEGCASLTENPYIQLANLDRFGSIYLRGCDSLPKILDFQNIPLLSAENIFFPDNTEQLIGVNPSLPLNTPFRFNGVINRFENLYFNSSVNYGYWYYGGGASNMSVTFVGEIERIPEDIAMYVDNYRKGFWNLDEASKTSFVNALKDYTGQETATLYGVSSYLSSEQIAIATAKNWSVT